MTAWTRPPAVEKPAVLQLNEHGRRVVSEILSGARPHRDMKHAFDWENTPEGHAYWSLQRNRTTLSSEARMKLEMALARVNAERTPGINQ